MINAAQVLNTGIRNFYLVNTAYPPDKECWAAYKSLPDYASWGREEGFGLYLHIPFCKTRCRFCEYVTLPHPGAEQVTQYIYAVCNELTDNSEKYGLRGKILYGFDIGGGTPTLLSEAQLELLFTKLPPFTDSLVPAPDYEQCIETNAEIACNNLALLYALTAYGFTRVSMGIQTISRELLANLNRGYQANLRYNRAVENFYKAGFKKINLDVMYGLPGQTLQSWEETLRFILTLEPDQISIYETRYKDSQLAREYGQLNHDTLITMYEHAYACLAAAGYSGHYGSTAFTRDFADKGLSSYLRRRTTDFIAYLGCGIGAQTMTREYLAYNYGKNTFNLASYITGAAGRETSEYFYKLPREEVLAKYIAIAFYLGFINYSLLSARMGINFLTFYEEQLAFLLKEELINLDAEKITLTKRGYRVYHGIIALFYPAHTLEYIVNKAGK